jgi:hypothetical protein
MRVHKTKCLATTTTHQLKSFRAKISFFATKTKQNKNKKKEAQKFSIWTKTGVLDERSLYK